MFNQNTIGRIKFFVRRSEERIIRSRYRTKKWIETMKNLD